MNSWSHWGWSPCLVYGCTNFKSFSQISFKLCSFCWHFHISPSHSRWLWIPIKRFCTNQQKSLARICSYRGKKKSWTICSSILHATRVEVCVSFTHPVPYDLSVILTPSAVLCWMQLKSASSALKHCTGFKIQCHVSSFQYGQCALNEQSCLWFSSFILCMDWR